MLWRVLRDSVSPSHRVGDTFGRPPPCDFPDTTSFRSPKNPLCRFKLHHLQESAQATLSRWVPVVRQHQRMGNHSDDAGDFFRRSKA